VNADQPAGTVYTVVLSPGARRALSETLPSAAAFAAWEFIIGPLAQRPRVVGVPLRDPFDGLWRARRGEYRVRYRIDESNQRVIVLDVDHRRDAYRP
jgi:mRNA-degrading endonuclease RelE of RelBE toxin-antitoxin system